MIPHQIRRLLESFKASQKTLVYVTLLLVSSILLQSRQYIILKRNYDTFFPLDSTTIEHEAVKAEDMSLVNSPTANAIDLADSDSDVQSVDTTKAKYVLSQFKSKQQIKFQTKLKPGQQLRPSPNTIVSAYFRLSSKHSSSSYDAWMKNFLSVQDSMVLFLSGSDRALIDQVWQMRQHALDRTVIVEMELKDLQISKLVTFQGEQQNMFWQNQLDIDREKRIHKSYEVFWIWLSKSWLVNQAMELEFFGSHTYMWSDIGSFRNRRLNGKEVMRFSEKQIPRDDRILFMAHRDPKQPQNPLWNDKFREKLNYYTSGSQLAGSDMAWKKYHAKFAETVDLFIQKNLFIGEDQCVLQATCNLNDVCAYVPARQVSDNNYFGLRTVLSTEKEYELFYPTVSFVPQDMSRSECGYNYCN